MDTDFISLVHDLYAEGLISEYEAKSAPDAPHIKYAMIERKDGEVMELCSFIEDGGPIDEFSFSIYPSREAIAEGDFYDQGDEAIVCLAETVTNWYNA